MGGAPPPRDLDETQKRALVEEGYVLLPGAVPPPLVEGALRAINHSLGSEGIAKDRLPTFRARTFTPELIRSEAIRALWGASALPSLAASAIGPGKVRTPSEGQIALRFPTSGPGSPAVPHIDGVSAPGNGVPPGTLYHFTALAGVFLSDALEPDRGNLTVWPGSHRTLERHFRAHGPGSVVGGYPRLALGPPRALAVRAGDAVLAHYMLAHGVAPNLGPHVRYAVFFRLHHVDHRTDDTGPLVDIWREWVGLRGLVTTLADQ